MNFHHGNIIVFKTLCHKTFPVVFETAHNTNELLPPFSFSIIIFDSNLCWQLCSGYSSIYNGYMKHGNNWKWDAPSKFQDHSHLFWTPNNPLFSNKPILHEVGWQDISDWHSPLFIMYFMYNNIIMYLLLLDANNDVYYYYNYVCTLYIIFLHLTMYEKVNHVITYLTFILFLTRLRFPLFSMDPYHVDF